MLIITKNTTNYLTLTLSERTEIENGYFLFVLKSKFEKGETRVFNSINTSTHKKRYDRFSVVETTSPDNTDGEVNLFKGEWDYFVYESESQTLDIEETTGKILETGLLIVK